MLRSAPSKTTQIADAGKARGREFVPVRHIGKSGWHLQLLTNLMLKLSDIGTRAVFFHGSDKIAKPDFQLERVGTEAPNLTKSRLILTIFKFYEWRTNLAVDARVKD